MNKILRFSFLMLLAFVANVSFAQNKVKFVAGTDSIDRYTASKEGITIKTSDGMLADEPYRFWSGATATFSSTVGNITEVVFYSPTNAGAKKYGPDCFTDPSVGSYSYEGKVGTWTGDASSFTLDAKAQVRCDSIVVTYTPNGKAPEETVAMPTISGETSFAQSTTVTITAENGTEIYYTTDGQDPDDRAELYTAPFELTATATVKAIAYKGSIQSEIASAKFTKVTVISVAEALQTLAAGTQTSDVVMVKGIISNVKEVSTSYGNATYNISVDGANTDTLVVYRGKYLDGAKFTDESQILVGDTVVVSGVLTNYTKNDVTTPELTNSSLVSLGRPSADVVAVDNFADFIGLAKSTVANLSMNNAKVLYTWTSNNGNTSAYLRDNTKALLFYNTGIDFQANQDVTGTVCLTRNEYKGMVQAGKNDDTNVDGLTLTAGDEAEAKVITVDQAADNVSDLVLLQNVTITEETTTSTSGTETTKYYAVSGDNKLQIYDGFHLELALAAAENASVKGIITQYNTTYEIYPVEDINTTTGINEIKNNTVAKDVRYNIAGQRVANNYRGIVIVNGKKFVNK